MYLVEAVEVAELGGALSLRIVCHELCLNPGGITNQYYTCWNSESIPGLDASINIGPVTFPWNAQLKK